MFTQRNPQPIGQRGSLKWIQQLVDGNSALLTDAVRAAIGRPAEWTIDWVSPRRDDEWAEYRDAGFLTTLNLPHLIDDLSAFWPKGGPQWDALGKSSDGTRILVEAKAHTAEMTSTCGAGATSLAQIRQGLDTTKSTWGAADVHNWLTPYYQYANRLAHLQFLRQRGVEALLVFVYFVGDMDMGGPRTTEEWQPYLQTVYGQLGLTGDARSRGVVNVFLPVEALAPVV